MSKHPALQKLVKEINAKYAPEGVDRNVIQFGSDVKPVQAVPSSSLALGYVLGIGGWPKGRMIEILGKEHAGKTTMAFMALRDCFDDAKGKRAVAFIDLEHRFNPSWAEFVGLTVNDDLLLIQPEYAEDASDIMRGLALTNEVCAIAFDSVGAAMSKPSHEAFDDRERVMATTAGPMTRNVNLMAPVADFHDTTVFYVNQLRADMSGGGGHAIHTPGGHALKHMVSVRLYLRSGKEKYHERRPGFEQPVQVGYRMYFRTLKNSFAPPYREGASDFYFTPSKYYDGIGFDVQGDMATLGLALGIIEQNGSGWYDWDGVRIRGREKFFAEVKRLDREPELMKLIQGAMADLTSPTSVVPEGGEPDGPDLTDPDV